MDKMLTKDDLKKGHVYKVISQCIYGERVLLCTLNNIMEIDGKVLCVMTDVSGHNGTNTFDMDMIIEEVR